MKLSIGGGLVQLISVLHQQQLSQRTLAFSIAIMSVSKLSCLLMVAASALCMQLATLQGVYARPSQDLVDTPHHPVLNNAGRDLMQSPPGPASAGCAAAGLSCCYSPTWWIEQQPAPSVTCTSGSQTGVNAETLLSACAAGQIGSNVPCIGCSNTNFKVDCTYYENIGDYTGSFPCTTNDWNGQTITVYDQSNLVGGNNEIVWSDAAVPSNEHSGVQACNVPQGASYTLTATYSKSSSWNIGVQLGAKILKDYEAKLTAGYSETYTRGTNAGVTIHADYGQHATVTSGALVHHTIGWWDVKLAQPYLGCSEYRIDNVAADLVMPDTDPNFPTDWGVEAKPCGYPTLDGKLN